MMRLCLVCALPAEARPWLDYYRLRANSPGPFRTWQSDDVALVVSGIGQHAAAAACGYLAAHAGASRSTAWINAGIAGHPRLARGAVALVDRCAGAAGVYHPSLPIATSLARAPCVTVDDVERDFAEDALYDMEGYGFYHAASRFSYLELVHAVKVVSDNRAKDTGDLDRETVSRLVADAMPAIVSGLVEPLLEAAREVSLDESPEDLTDYLERWRFSASNERRLRRLAGDCRALAAEHWPSAAEFRACRSAGEVLDRLHARIHGEGRS